MDPAVATVGLREEMDWEDEQPTFPPYQAEEERAAVAPGARLPEEPDRPWAAFKCFRDLGQNRSLSEVNRRFYGAKKGQKRDEKPCGRIREWRRRFRWAARARAWDDAQDAFYRQASAEKLKEMAARHVAVAQALQERVAQRLARLTDQDLDRMSPEGLMYIFTQAARLERTARGVPTSVKKVIHENRGEPDPPFEPTLRVTRDEPEPEPVA
jgi:hypothetical protein